MPGDLSTIAERSEASTEPSRARSSASPDTNDESPSYNSLVSQLTDPSEGYGLNASSTSFTQFSPLAALGELPAYLSERDEESYFGEGLGEGPRYGVSPHTSDIGSQPDRGETWTLGTGPTTLPEISLPSMLATPSTPERGNDGTKRRWVWKVTVLCIVAILAVVAVFAGTTLAVKKSSSARNTNQVEGTAFEPTMAPRSVQPTALTDFDFGDFDVVMPDLPMPDGPLPLPNEIDNDIDGNEETNENEAGAVNPNPIGCPPRHVEKRPATLDGTYAMIYDVVWGEIVARGSCDSSDFQMTMTCTNQGTAVVSLQDICIADFNTIRCQNGPGRRLRVACIGNLGQIDLEMSLDHGGTDCFERTNEHAIVAAASCLGADGDMPEKHLCSQSSSGIIWQGSSIFAACGNSESCDLSRGDNACEINHERVRLQTNVQHQSNCLRDTSMSRGEGEPCGTDSNCKSRICAGEQCRSGPGCAGTVCNSDHHCQSNSCTEGTCV